MSTFGDKVVATQTISIAAMEEASRMGQRIAGVDHMFLALVMSEHTAGQVLRSFGMTLESARDAVVTQHREQLESIGIQTEPIEQERIVFHETGGYDWSKSALEVIKRASVKGKSGDAAALLRELVAEPSGIIGHLLLRLGTSGEQVLRRLDEMESITGATSARQPNGLLSRRSEAFIPAPVERVWKLLSDPHRIPEWDFGIAKVEDERVDRDGVQLWSARVQTQRPDGKPIRVKPGFEWQYIERLEFFEQSRVAWRFSHPAVDRANSRNVTIALEPSAGGTQLQITLEWLPHPERKRGGFKKGLGFVLRPIYGYLLKMQLLHISAGISRVFR